MAVTLSLLGFGALSRVSDMAAVYSTKAGKASSVRRLSRETKGRARRSVPVAARAISASVPAPQTAAAHGVSVGICSVMLSMSGKDGPNARALMMPARRRRADESKAANAPLGWCGGVGVLLPAAVVARAAYGPLQDVWGQEGLKARGAAAALSYRQQNCAAGPRLKGTGPTE
ncbi:MAG: hypothetical protein AAF281_10105 [Pseudomonadota bacterium]